jgi:hypothetical protein
MGSTALPTDSQSRKDIPLVSGVLDYFPAALAAVAAVSKAGNDKHNPGQPLHWARGKSGDQADALVRHLLERGTTDPDTGQRHSALVAWRALALLQTELEDAGEAPLARGARLPDGDAKTPRFEHDGPVLMAPTGSLRVKSFVRLGLGSEVIEFTPNKTHHCLDSNCVVPGLHEGAHTDGGVWW